MLHVSPGAQTCAGSRTVVKHKGSGRPSVDARTLLPCDEAFDLGPTLASASGAMKLNQPRCAKFCVVLTARPSG